MDSKQEATAKLLRSGWSEETLRVWVRANGRCEYCDKDLQAHPDDYFHGYNIDHVIPASHDGPSHPDNYALACRTCNLIKRNHDFRNGETGVTREITIARARRYISAERAHNAKRMADALALLTICGLTRP
jgi:5-methylcytosine-specific restriction endonuclease McrA